MTSSIQQDVRVLEDTLDLLAIVQQHGALSPILGPQEEPSNHQDLNIPFSKKQFCTAIKGLRDQGNVTLMRQFFERIFSSLY
ncbi:hypothetical protein BGZ46_001953, partial [Entomortierella lignicola]